MTRDLNRDFATEKFCSDTIVRFLSSFLSSILYLFNKVVQRLIIRDICLCNFKILHLYASNFMRFFFLRVQYNDMNKAYYVACLKNV